MCLFLFMVYIYYSCFSFFNRVLVFRSFKLLELWNEDNSTKRLSAAKIPPYASIRRRSDKEEDELAIGYSRRNPENTQVFEPTNVQTLSRLTSKPRQTYQRLNA